MNDVSVALAATLPTNDSLERFTPLADFVLIEPKKKNTSAGGIALPEGVDDGPSVGTVVKVGPGRTTEFGVEIPVPVQPGDDVFLIIIGAPLELTFSGKKYLLARTRDLVGKAA